MEPPEWAREAAPARPDWAADPAPPPAPAPAAGAPARAQPAPDSATAFLSGNINKGLAGVVGMPAGFVENLLNLGIAAYGRGRGMGAEAPAPLHGSVGTPAWFEDQMRKRGLITAASDPTSKAGEYGAAAIQAGVSAPLGAGALGARAPQIARSVIPGTASGVTGQAAADIGGEEWRGVGSMAPSMKQLAKPPSAGERGTADRQAADFAKAKEMGIPVPPRAMKPDKQQQNIQDAVNQELRFPAGTELSAKTINAANKAYWQQYEAVIRDPALGGTIHATPQFRQQVRQMAVDERKLRNEFPNIVKDKALQEALSDFAMRPQFTTEGAMGIVKRLRDLSSANLGKADDANVQLGRVQKGMAKAMEDLIEQNVQRVGRPELMQNFREARTMIAKGHDVLESLDPVTRKIDPARLSKMLTEGSPLSGALKQVAEVAGQFPGAVKAPGGSGDMFTQRMSPSAVLHPKSMALHAATKWHDPITLSRPYQEAFVNPANKLSPEQNRALQYILSTIGSQRGQIPPPPQ